ncbi:hypothetical protein FB45DRAFT_868675 [Roridomyces roridus]|uniref:Uncharacterized protein n=1 Tax=Roridomyces roridus TaxID=1738132 RepID=A0AAD7FLY6_9AGAR|nr:hypothetical protein FB45DRAFT_868675 [Roridomyces roridus]
MYMDRRRGNDGLYAAGVSRYLSSADRGSDWLPVHTEASWDRWASLDTVEKVPQNYPFGNRSQTVANGFPSVSVLFGQNCKRKRNGWSLRGEFGPEDVLIHCVELAGDACTRLGRRCRTLTTLLPPELEQEIFVTGALARQTVVCRLDAVLVSPLIGTGSNHSSVAVRCRRGKWLGSGLTVRVGIPFVARIRSSSDALRNSTRHLCLVLVDPEVTQPIFSAASNVEDLWINNLNGDDWPALSAMPIRRLRLAYGFGCSEGLGLLGAGRRFHVDSGEIDGFTVLQPDRARPPSQEQELIHKWASSTVYSAGADTVAPPLFLPTTTHHSQMAISSFCGLRSHWGGRKQTQNQQRVWEDAEATISRGGSLGSRRNTGFQRGRVGGTLPAYSHVGQ